jgi:NitT/TauT family transport system permease protein
MSLASLDAARGAPDEAAFGAFASRASLGQSALALAAGAVWLGFAFLTLRWPDTGDWGRGPELAWAAAIFGGLLVAGGLFGGFWPRAAKRLRRSTPWFLALGLFFSLWQATTAKSTLLPQPFFPPPHAMLEVFIDDWAKLAESVAASIRLELLGFAAGASAGFVIGVLLGWSRAFGYWAHPVMRLIGPLPAIAAFLIFKVAIPAALPHVFVGLFMGLGASFAVLVTAEMMGVKAGLGFYLQWAQGWAAYANMYAALLIMSLMCSGLVTLLFKLRDRVLSYQKADVKW